MLFSPRHKFAGAVAAILLLSLISCKEKGGLLPEESRLRPAEKGCRQCHDLTLDANHAFDCASCHGGNSQASSQAEAHAGLVTNPAGPEQMQLSCGGCHSALVEKVVRSSHFTLRNEINLVRAAFGALEPLDSLTEVPVHPEITSPLELADDLLRRRCLRCHLYTEGDPYPETRRGTGCAACHLSYRGGRLLSHHFLKKPTDQECLHCHYGNHVGADYYGRYEHDFGVEYRTPYRTDGVFSRPYGVEYHQLQPDVHQLAGMGCTDCHAGAGLMGLGHADGNAPADRPSCAGCHDPRQRREQGLPENIILENGQFFLAAAMSGKKLRVPDLRHPAHFERREKAACAVCHAQWTFNDRGMHLLRQDVADYDQWYHLSVQGAFEIEEQLARTDPEPPFMRDKITGIAAPGIWLKAFELRRWETPIIARDKDGSLQTFRPVLDLHLSFVKAGGEVFFDCAGISAGVSPWQPYTPHTIGKAGAFYRQRLKPNIEEWKTTP